MQPVLPGLEQQHKQAEGQGEENGASSQRLAKRMVSTASSIFFSKFMPALGSTDERLRGRWASDAAAAKPAIACRIFGKILLMVGFCKVKFPRRAHFRGDLAKFMLGQSFLVENFRSAAVLACASVVV